MRDTKKDKNPDTRTNKQKCIMQWKWLRNNPSKKKDDYFRSLGWSYSEIEPFSFKYCLCYACLEAESPEYRNGDCGDCPVRWTYNWEVCGVPESPYDLWYNYNVDGEYDKAASCANQIVVIAVNTWEE